jgi:hypothetical protein
LFLNISRFSDDLVIVQRGDSSGSRESGLIEIHTLNEVIPFGEFDHIFAHGDNFAVASNRNGESTIIDVISGHRFTTDYFVMRVSNGMALVASENGNAIIDIFTEEEIIPFGRFDSINMNSNGMASVTSDGQTALIDIVTGEEIIPFGRFDAIVRKTRCNHVVVQQAEDRTSGIVRIHR